MSKQLYLIAKFDLKKADKAYPIFKKHAKASRAKLGCLFFYLIQDKDDPSKFATMECWENYDYFEQHVADDEHEAFFKKIKKHFRKDPEVMEANLVMGME
ncbi:putative quinol monooxygenase [Neolewinella antarctica]|uniref:Quinol monooxygenase YgiN n=1 Tax=Neolewinella antarctica TaxID=442734 RepID=A0ABX0XBL6_9BACT|nr:antibiotic biosynthesis monooxygenase [Neolewinella antarctica]NJC26223.1 quinol monooxygenase YgiN [Neolewinella antarctica]